jgi:hypothetical protein
MYLQLYIPLELELMDNSTCEAVYGLSTSVNCTYNKTNRILSVNDGFHYESTPDKIQFKLKSFVNPSSDIITSTF